MESERDKRRFWLRALRDGDRVRVRGWLDTRTGTLDARVVEVL